MDKHGDDDQILLVSVDARNAFNNYSRQALLKLIVERAPNLARFVNLLYGGDAPPIVFGDHILRSAEGSQQGDPLSMLLFSLVIQPMLKRVSAECDLLLNVWYADDGALVGTHAQVKKALDIIAQEGLKVQYFMRPDKSRAFWPTMNVIRMAPLVLAYPLKVQRIPTGLRSLGISDGIVISGAPLRSPQLCAGFLENKLSHAADVLAQIAEVPDARMAFHMPRITAGVCKFTHLVRMMPPPSLCAFAQRFDALQRKSFAAKNFVPLNDCAALQDFLPARAAPCPNP